MVSDPYNPLDLKRRPKGDSSQITPDHSTISSLGRISDDLDEKLKKVSAYEDSAYLIEQTVLMQTKADNIIAQKKQELSVSGDNFNPSDSSFKDLEETVVKQMESEADKIANTLPLSLRTSYKTHALNIRRNTSNELKQLKIDLLTDSSKNRVLKTSSILSDTIALDPSFDTFENSVNQIKALTEVLPVSKSQQEKYLNTARQSFGQAQGEALKNKDPELLVRWYYGFNQPQPLRSSVQSSPQDFPLKAGAGKEASHVVAETKSSDVVDSKNSSESQNIAEIIKEDKNQEDLPPVTLEKLNKKSPDIPFKGWEYLTIEQKQTLINGAIGKLSARRSQRNAQSEKFLTDAETLVKNGGVFDFTNPIFHPDYINNTFKPKTAERLNNKVEIYKYVSHHNGQFKGLTLNQGLNYLASLKPKDGATALDWERYNATKDAFNKSYDELRSDPLKYVLNNNIAGAKRIINPQNPVAWGVEARTRSISDQTLKQTKGVELQSYFSSEETEAMEKFLQNTTPQNAGMALELMHKAGGFDSEMTRKFSSGFKNPMLGFALAVVSEGDIKLATKVIDGQRILAKLKGQDSFGRDRTKRVYDEFDVKFQELINEGLVLPYGSDRSKALSLYRDATIAVLASDAVSNNKTLLEHSGETDNPVTIINPLTWLNPLWSEANIQKAFNEVTGGGYKNVLGSHVFAPRGMDADRFSDEFPLRAMHALKQAGNLTTNKGKDVSSRVSSYTYYNLPDNKYGILGPARTPLISKKTGEAVIIDFSAPFPSEDSRSFLERKESDQSAFLVFDEMNIDKEFVSNWEKQGNIK